MPTTPLQNNRNSGFQVTAACAHLGNAGQILIQGRSDSVLLVASGADGDGAGSKETAGFLVSVQLSLHRPALAGEVRHLWRAQRGGWDYRASAVASRSLIGAAKRKSPSRPSQPERGCLHRGRIGVGLARGETPSSCLKRMKKAF